MPSSISAARSPQRRVPPVRRPLGSTLVAWGFVLISVLAMVSMARHLFQGRLSFHVGVLLFPVALGLFRGRVSAIMWARLQGGFMMALGGLFLLLYALHGEGYHAHLFGHVLQSWQKHLFVVAVCSITIGLGIAVRRAVTSRAHLAYVAAREGFPPIPEPGSAGQNASAR